MVQLPMLEADWCFLFPASSNLVPVLLTLRVLVKSQDNGVFRPNFDRLGLLMYELGARAAPLCKFPLDVPQNSAKANK